jgi:hypothetical protein
MDHGLPKKLQEVATNDPRGGILVANALGAMLPLVLTATAKAASFLSADLHEAALLAVTRSTIVPPNPIPDEIVIGVGVAVSMLFLIIGREVATIHGGVCQLARMTLKRDIEVAQAALTRIWNPAATTFRRMQKPGWKEMRPSRDVETELDIPATAKAEFSAKAA